MNPSSTNQLTIRPTVVNHYKPRYFSSDGTTTRTRTGTGKAQGILNS